VRGANSALVRVCLLILGLVCTRVVHAQAASLAFQARGLLPYKAGALIAWSDAGLLQMRGADSRWRPACRLPLTVINEVVASDDGLLVLGALDETRGAVLLTNESCSVTRTWQLGKEWAELVLTSHGPSIVTAHGSARLLPDGKLTSIAPHIQSEVTRARMGSVHWFEFPSGVVLCHNRDLTMRTGAPGWCALQRANGWHAIGEWEDALQCAGLVLVREGVDKKRVRWTARRPDSGVVVASTVVLRGAASCANNQFLLSADTSLRLIDVATLKTRWRTPTVGGRPEAVAVLPREIVYTSGSEAGAVIRSVAWPAIETLRTSPPGE